ncbi:MAG: NAD-dependent epimerase/dehydratase family protein [Phycisphaerales bacterium]
MNTDGFQSSSVRRVLVTGGSGFIGSHLTDQLLARGDHVTVIDDLSTGRRSNLPEHHERLTFMHGDLGETLSRTARVCKFDEIYHLAAAVGVKLITDDPIGSIETNVEQTAELLRFADSHGKPPVLLASSSEVYGKSAKLPFAESDDVVYGPTTVSRWSYAYSKAVDEYLGLAYAAKRGIPVVVARFFNTVGPRQVGEYGMVLPRFVERALRNDAIEVHGDGEQSRCLCDVRDVARALPKMLSTRTCHGEVINTGSDERISMLELARTVIATLDSSSEIRMIPYERVYGSNFEDLRHRVPDLSKIRRLIGFTPEIPLRKTILDLAAALTCGAGTGEHA